MAWPLSRYRDHVANTTVIVPTYGVAADDAAVAAIALGSASTSSCSPRASTTARSIACSSCGANAGFRRRCARCSSAVGRCRWR